MLESHLKNVAEVAASFGNNDTVKFLFNIAGMLHDFGKYQPEFQKYLIEGGRRGSVPHAVWGAGYARILGMNEIPYAIDGHHKGLPNKSDLNLKTKKFIKKDEAEFDSVIESFKKDTAFSENDTKSLSLAYSDPLQKELFIRYLFSALIDADWLDTEAVYEPDKPQDRGNYILPIDEMIEKLEKEFSNKPTGGEINQLRNYARKIALEKANKAPGFYSLNLPTGIGKTLISIAWALHHAKEHKLKRIIIVLPYINIIDQTASELKRIFDEKWVLEHHSSYNENNSTIPDDENSLDAIQKRKILACENWDYPIIVTTTVQFFESLFSGKPSKCRKNHNIAESVVIFDEVQSLPKEIILPTLSMLKNIQTVMGASFLFCTATQPAFEKRDKFNGIDSIYPLINNPLEIFGKTRRVDYHLLQDLNAIELEELRETVKETNSSVLAIFNTKKAVLEFYNCTKNIGGWENKYHLSTAMCPVHRRQIIDNIRDDLEKKRKILVSSTQLIEAGVDFDFPCVFRAMAPLEAVIQSAGRCNREGKLPEHGKVYLFKLEDSGMPDKTYGACAEHAKSLIQMDINRLYDHNFFREYYSQVVNLFVDPDKNNIIKAQEDFNFETVSESYRLISNATEGLFIYNYNEESKKLLHSIEYKEFLSRDDYRKMQAFTVQVYQNFLFKNQSMYKKMPQGFLVWYGNYDSNTGISVEPIEADKLIV